MDSDVAVLISPTLRTIAISAAFIHSFSIGLRGPDEITLSNFRAVFSSPLAEVNSLSFLRTLKCI